MSERALKMLAWVLAGLVLIWLLVSFFPRGDRGPGEASGALAGFFDGATPEAVSTVRVSSPGEAIPVELTRLEGSWKVNGFQADSSIVAGFWSVVGSSEVGELVASNPGNHRRMGVAADSTWTLELDVSGTIRSLIVGNPGTRYNTVFVRHPDEDGVHLLRGGLRAHVTRSLDDWRNKRLAHMDTSSVWRLEVEGPETSFVVERSDSLWALDDGVRADSASVRTLLGELTRLDAVGFYQADDSIPELGARLTALSEAGDTLLLLEIGAGEGERWARIAGDSITYRLASYRASRLLPDPDRVRGGG
jgi:hypothetical protein